MKFYVRKLALQKDEFRVSSSKVLDSHAFSLDQANAGDVEDFDYLHNNEFAARATGGVRFVSAIDSNGNPTAGVQLAAGSGSWSSLSDRNSKTGFEAVTPRAILDKVDALDISEWSYKAQGVGIRHLGPMAQDFYAQFHLGEDEKHIDTVDEEGVALAAIQGLHQELKDEQAKNADLTRTVATQQAEIDALIARMSALEAKVDGGNSN